MFVWSLSTATILNAGSAGAPSGAARVGVAAWSFNRFTFVEAVDRTAALGLKHIEAFVGQRVSPASEAKLDEDLPDAALAEMRAKLQSANVTLTSVYIHELSAEEPACRRSFEFASKLGVETIVSEPPPEALGHIERLCAEFGINVALHNHPQGSSRYWHPREALKTLEGRGPRLGVCADLGHWQRSGIRPLDGIRLLGSRLMSLHVKDLNEASPQGHDVVWGTGVGDLAAVLGEVERLGVRPTLVAIEYEHLWEDNRREIAACAAFFYRTMAALASARSAAANDAGGAARFRAGAHAVDISPDTFPVVVNAMFTERSADKVVDRLWAKALVLEDGRAPVALCVVDTCMMPRDLIDRAKLLAAELTPVPVGRMLVSATHTHSAPSAMGCLGSRVDAGYAAVLPAKIAAAIAGAVSNLAPARVGWGVVDDWQHTFNRRWIRRPDRMLTDPFGELNVRAHMHPGHESPDAIGPSGPVDPALSVLAVQSRSGRPLAVFANYSQHYYDSPLLSSDYYGRFAQHLAKRLGVEDARPPFVAIMSQGTSGDLMWMDYGSPRRDIGYDAYAVEIVDRVADLYRRLDWHDDAPLRMAERTLSLGYRVPGPERLAWAREMALKLGDRLPQNLPEIYAGEAIHLAERQRTELTLQALRVGELGMTAIPNEVFALTGLKLKALSPLQPTVNIGLANGAEGYIPPPEQHALGGYTTWPARTAGLEVQAEPRILEALLSLLEQVADRPRRGLPRELGPYNQMILAARPTAYWRLDEMDGATASDISGQAHHASVEPGVAWFLPGVGSGHGRWPRPELTPSSYGGGNINRAAHFAGGRLRAPLPPLGERYSVELWLWNGLAPEVRPITGFLLSRGKDGAPLAGGEQLGIGGHRSARETGRLILAGPIPEGSTAIGRSPLGLRRWHHVVLVREGKQVAVYLDGQPDLRADGAMPAWGDGGELLLGGADDRNAGFEGRLDEVAVYSRALAAEEVAAHFANARTAPEQIHDR
jgi:sugar phosphate isomerase/epimerase